MLAVAVIAVAKVVTPMAVPMVVPTALMHQNSVIATAATVWANSFLGDKRRFIIPLLSRKGAAHRFAEDPSGRPYGTRYLLCRVEMNECRRLLCRGPVGKHSTLSKTFLSALLQNRPACVNLAQTYVCAVAYPP